MVNANAPPPPPVALAALSGLAPAKAQRLKQSLVQEARKRNIGVVDGAAPGAYQLSVNFHGNDQALGYRWELRDDAGLVVLALPGDAFDSAAPQADDQMLRIASTASTAVAYKLASLGYGTRVTSLTVPPPEYFVPADRNSAFEIDQETLNGPEIAQADTTLPTPGLLDAVLPHADEPPEDPVKDDAAAVNTAAADGRTVIRAVAVVPVKGAPGDGNQQLTQAMRATLRNAGWAVLESPRADALVVSGEVGVARGEAGKQRVAVRWNVASPEGKSLGDVKQANSVPAGSLDERWNEAAVAVAEAAASGIFDLVGKFR